LKSFLVIAAAAIGVVILTTAAVGSSTTAGDWAYPNSDLGNTRVADGSTISAANVSQLQQAWAYKLNVKGAPFGTFASTPVVQSGVVYLQDLGSNVLALDLASGKVIWSHQEKLPDVGPNGVAVDNGMVFAATPKSVFALDSGTGKLVWRNSSLVGKHGIGFTIQPQASGGRVYISTATQPGGGVAYALDEKTGTKVWSFQTVIDKVGQKVPAPGTGGAWNTPLLGTDGSVSFGIGNPYQPPATGLAKPGKRLYTDSTVNLDAATGKLRWYYQAVPNDFYDWDMQLSPIAATVNGTPAVIDAGKMGYVYAMNAKTGHLIWKTSVGVHNGHDHDGVLAMQHKLKLKAPVSIEPGIYGGVETNMAVSGNTVYAAVVDMPVPVTDLKAALGSPNFAIAKGEMVALDLTTGKVQWDTKLPTMPLGDATVSNDLVFTTLYNGKLVAFSRTTGKIVYSKKLTASSNSPIAIAGNTLLAAAGLPTGAHQTTELIALKLPTSG